MKISLLKIYTSKYAADPAVVIGNREGLTALRNALNDILENSEILTQALVTQDMQNNYFVQCREMSDDEVVLQWSKLPDQEDDLDNLSTDEYALLNRFADLDHE